VTDYCNQCAEALDDGDTVVLAHDGAYYHYDCWRDGGCEPPGLKPHDYQGEPMESVNPDHYKTGTVEAIDAIRSALGHQGFIDYCRGQVIRYLWRIGKKDDALVEIGKAQVYAQWIKDTLDGKDLTK
jgi:hypothetical protein